MQTMLKSMGQFLTSLAIALTLLLETAVSPALAQEILPHPEPPFTGKG